jgi:predicted transcriptional regulator
VTRHVYFDAVRVSLTNQVVAAYVRRTEIQISPLARNVAAAAIADPV